MNADILNRYDLLHVSEEATFCFSVGFSQVLGYN